MTDAALAVPLDDARRLAADAGRHGHRVVAECSGADELATRLPIDRPQLVVVAATPQYLNARLVAASDSLGIRLVVVVDGPAARRHASAVGILDVVAAPFSWSDLRGGVAAEPTPAFERAEPNSPERGRVIAVWGPSGAPGRTSLAIALAAELAATGRRVALADADTHAASVAPALGLLDEAPGFAAACRLVATGGLSSAEFDRLAVEHRVSSGVLRVLTGIGRASRWPELGSIRVAGVLAAIRDWADLTVLDVAAGLEQDEELASDVAIPRRNAATVTAVGDADRVVAVAAADPIGLSRFLRAHADLLELVPPERITVVVNKVRASAIGLDPSAQLRQTLARFGGIDDPVLVPWDPAAFDAALLGGRSLGEAAPRSPARAAITRLAAVLAAGYAPARTEST